MQGSAANQASAARAATPGSGAPQPGQHILEVGDTGNGALTSTTIPRLPPMPSGGAAEDQAEDEPQAPELEARAGDESESDSEEAEEEEQDVTTAGIECLLLRAAAANAAVQLGNDLSLVWLSGCPQWAHKPAAFKQCSIHTCL